MLGDEESRECFLPLSIFTVSPFLGWEKYTLFDHTPPSGTGSQGTGHGSDLICNQIGAVPALIPKLPNWALLLCFRAFTFTHIRIPGQQFLNGEKRDSREFNMCACCQHARNSRLGGRQDGRNIAPFHGSSSLYTTFPKAPLAQPDHPVHSLV